MEGIAPLLQKFGFNKQDADLPLPIQTQSEIYKIQELCNGLKNGTNKDLPNAVTVTKIMKI